MASRGIIAAGQVACELGDIDENVRRHAACAERAAGLGVGLLVFPELSLTGYEPALAAGLAMTLEDGRLGTLQGLSDSHGLWMVVGAPLKGEGARPGIGAIVLSPGRAARGYWKMHLGGEEPEHFGCGGESMAFEACGERIGLAICADAGRESHPRRYAEQGVTVYAAGVFLNAEWDKTDRPRLARWAERHGMAVVMSNHGASAGRLASVGRSAAWDEEGELLAEAPGASDCLVLLDKANGRWEGRVERV